MAVRISSTTADTQGDATATLFNSGYLRIYDGARPATSDTAVGAQTLLAELTFAATAMTTTVNGVLTAAAITSDSSANAAGTATWYRCFRSDGTTAICDGTVGTSGADLNLNSTAISDGAEVAVTSFVHTIPVT